MSGCVRTGVLAMALLAAACVKPDPDPRFTPAWEPFDVSGEGWARTKEALVVSDCQLHNLLSLPVPERNLSVEMAVTTAIRPPQLDLFSADVLDWILKNAAPEAEVVLEGSRRHPVTPVDGLVLRDQRRYGDTLIARFGPEPPDRAAREADD